MKRFLYSVAAMALLTTNAFADGLSRQVGAEAARLLVEVDGARKLASTRPASKPQPLTSALVADLQRFGLAASRLSLEIDARGGPQDLKCIFRGMAEETGRQLASASSAATGAQQAIALSRLSHMLSDAARIAPAADRPAAQKQTAADSSSAAVDSCPVVRDF